MVLIVVGYQQGQPQPFAPVAEEAPPTEWQTGAQATEPQVHTGPEPVGAPPGNWTAHQCCKAHNTQLHLMPADGPSQDMQGTTVQACLDQAVAHVTDARPGGSQEESVAVVPASDDEAEVGACSFFSCCCSP